MFFPTVVNNLIYDVVVIALVILLCMPGKKPPQVWAYPTVDPPR